jgi:hypothetical protein
VQLVAKQNYRSFGSHLAGLSFALVLFSLLAGTAAAADGSERDKGAAGDPLLATRARRATSSETAFGGLSWTSDVLYRSMPKLVASEGTLQVVAQSNFTAGPGQSASLDRWPGLALRDGSPAINAGRGAISTANAAVPAGRHLTVPGLRDWAADHGATTPPGGGQARKQHNTVSTAPMTSGEKFMYFMRRSFLSFGPYVYSALSGVWGEALDTDDKKHRNDAGEFLADSATRAARSFAFRATANFFEKFAYASMFKQDPRYHRSNNTGFGARVGYAVSRIFVTQGDRGGRQFNASFILGGLTAAGISNLWERDERVNAGDTFQRFGSHVAFTALTNILREFIGGQ